MVSLAVSPTVYAQVPSPTPLPNYANPTPQPWQSNQMNTGRQKGIEQYERDRQQLIERQKRLDQIHREADRYFENEKYANVKYSLPACTSKEGAQAYQEAYAHILNMASGTKPFNLMEANFTVENAFFNNQATFEEFQQVIGTAGQFLEWKMNELGYDKNSNLAKNLMLFRFFSDTLVIKSKNMVHYPFQYDFEDYMGKQDWTKMFVSKALATNSGQCHSLPLLYLILADEIGAKAQLAYSPSHSYIKFQDDNGKWHNVELTNGTLSTDAFVLQSGYIKAEALQNKIYMQPLTEKQLISHNLFGLAKGYIAKYCFDGFVETVINKSIELDPNNINAHALKSDYLTLRFHYVVKQLDINENNYKQKLMDFPKARQLFNERNTQYKKIDFMGYEDMPEEAYQEWLNSMKDAKFKQNSQQMLMELNNKIGLER